MTDWEPKHYRLARRAYEAFYNEQPQVWFDDLSHAYQMRWVNSARAILEELKKHGPASAGPIRRRRHIDPRAAEALVAQLPRDKAGRVRLKDLQPEQRREYLLAKKLLWRLRRKGK